MEIRETYRHHIQLKNSIKNKKINDKNNQRFCTKIVANLRKSMKIMHHQRKTKNIKLLIHFKKIYENQRKNLRKPNKIKEN